MKIDRKTYEAPSAKVVEVRIVSTLLQDSSGLNGGVGDGGDVFS